MFIVTDRVECVLFCFERLSLKIFKFAFTRILGKSRHSLCGISEEVVNLLSTQPDQNNIEHDKTRIQYVHI